MRNSGSGRKVGDEMSLRLVAGKTAVLRAFVAAGCIGALILALVLSAVPQLHEELHAVSGAANHECAVTLLTSGNYQHTPVIEISVAPAPRPTTFVHAFADFQLVSAHLEFSLLEHAPPAIS